MNEAWQRLADHPTAMEALQYQFVGLIIVLIALGGLSVACSALSTVFRLAERGAKKRTALAADRPADIAVIAAAAAAVIAEPHRVTTIQLVPEGKQWDVIRTAWSMEGRRQIYSSHKTR